MLVSICGLVGRHGLRSHRGHGAGRSPRPSRTASRRTWLPTPPCCVAFATILGCLAMPGWRTLRPSRRAGFFFTLMLVFIVLDFRQGFLSGEYALPWFFVCLFFLGLGGAEFLRLHSLAARAISHRMSRQRLCVLPLLSPASSVLESRFWWEPACATSARWECRWRSRRIAFAIGLLLTPLGEETRGRPLPP